MRFEIRSNFEVYSKKSLLIHDLKYKKALKTNRQNAAAATVMILVGIYLLGAKENFGLALFPTGILVAYYSWHYFSQHKRQKRQLVEMMEKHRDKSIQESASAIEFTAEYFRAESYFSDMKLRWDVFRGYMIAGQTLILLTDFRSCFRVGRKRGRSRRI